MNMFCISITLLAVFGTSVHAQCDKEALYAKCRLLANPDIPSEIQGEIQFRQIVDNETCQYDDLEIMVDITSMSTDYASRLHGFHVHNYGDLSGGCGTTGGHFVLMGSFHGAPQKAKSKRHVGDWGNVKQDRTSGDIQVTLSDYYAQLYGKSNIIGRAIVLHEGRDDMGRGGDAGSMANGNAGPRLACCVIGISAPWE